jgi:muramoyltetrapeptide carboxypeptidase LdcA involved in peptidoglycan recycling
MKLIESGDTVAFVRCSDALESDEKVNQVIEIFRKKEINVEIDNYVYDKYASAKRRADFLNHYFENSDIKAIFDISGGDMANEILEYLDYDIIKKNPKPFFGYSDLTCVLNAIYKKTSNPSYLYQVRNIADCNAEAFFDYLLAINFKMISNDYKFIQSDLAEGEVIGGNIRCFLKLAGTEYFPDCSKKILFLESRSGDENRIRAYFAQLKQMGIFEQISALYLGSFTELEAKNKSDVLEKIVLENTCKSLPVLKTDEIGHQKDSKILELGIYTTIHD